MNVMRNFALLIHRVTKASEDYHTRPVVARALHALHYGVRRCCAALDQANKVTCKSAQRVH
jgi:hypothetical protein